MNGESAGREIIGDTGGGKGIRTLDPSVANAVLSQLSYAPTEAASDPLSANIKKQMGSFDI